MRVISELIDCMHLDPGYALLSVQNVITCMELFRMLDIHHNSTLNDIQFWVFIRAFTDLSKHDADLLFHLLDVDHSGEMDFEEFYLIFCVLVASKDQYEKEFIYRHSNSIFRLIDSDASGLVSNAEFSQMGVLFNFDIYSISSIFEEFDISGDKNLDFGEFRLFTMACIDEQRAVEAHSKVSAYKSYHYRLLVSLQDTLKQYITTKILPKPAIIEFLVDRVRPPFIPRAKRWKHWFDPEFFISIAHSTWHIIQRWKIKALAYIRFFFSYNKALLRKLRCRTCFKKRCKFCYKIFKRKKTSDRENYRYYNRRQRKKKKKLWGKNNNYDTGLEEMDKYIPPNLENEDAEGLDYNNLVPPEKGVGPVIPFLDENIPRSPNEIMTLYMKDQSKDKKSNEKFDKNQKKIEDVNKKISKIDQNKMNKTTPVKTTGKK